MLQEVRCVIDEKALISFLRKNKSASAFLDCFEVEPYKGNLLKQKNVFPLPHIASYTYETRKEMENSSSKKIINYLEKFNLKCLFDLNDSNRKN